MEGRLSEKTYDLELPAVMRVLPFVVLTAGSVILPWLVLRDPSGPTLLLVPLIGVVAWQWWAFLTIAHRVVIHEDGALEWVAFARRVRILPEDVVRIAPDGGQIGLFTVRHTGGKVRFVNQITGFHEVLLHIKSRNPGVVLRGC